jgi:Tfp pilus assembly protein PilF
MRKFCIYALVLLAIISCSEKPSDPSQQNDSSPDTVYFDLLQRATAYVQSGKLEKAEQTLSQAENIEPKLPMAYYMHGILYYNQRDVDNSSEYFTKALQRCNEEEMPKLISDINSLTSLPDTEEEDELIKKAREAELIQQRTLLQKALEINNYNSYSSFLLAENYKKSGNESKAMALYKKVIALHPAHKGALTGLSELYKKSDKELYKKTLKQRMQYFGVKPDIRHLLAILYYDENDVDKAVIMLERNNNDFPDYYLSYYLLGEIYIKQKNTDMARQKLVVFSDNQEQKYFSGVTDSREYKDYKTKALKLIRNIQ